MKYKLLLAGLSTLMLTAAAPTPYGYPLFDGADPDVNYFAGQYWIYTTDGVAWSSNDLANWTNEGVIFRLDENVTWLDRTRNNILWAPDMVALNGKYNFYYSVGGSDTAQKPNSIGVAVCDTPRGPCRDSGQALLTPTPGTTTFEAIDPMVYPDGQSGNLYLYAGGSAAQDGYRLRIYTLTADGLRTVDKVTAPGSGEAYQATDFTEAPFMHRRGNLYYLSYSGGFYNNSSYRVRYATSNSPTGPWTDRGLILQSDAITKGPGHHAFLQLPNSSNWIAAYHRWEGRTGDGPYSGPRQTALARVNFNGDGTIQPIDPNAH